MGTPRSLVTIQFRWTGAVLLAGLLFACSEEDPGCRIRTDADGLRTLVCDDGSTARLDPIPPPETATGILRGEARLFGRSRHDDITAFARGSGGSASTSTRVGADGRWELEIATGIYEVELSAPGYVSESLKQVVVAPGEAIMPPIVLHSRGSIHSEAPTRILVAPDERGLLLFFGEPGALWWWSPDASTRFLSDSAAFVSFTARGDRIVFLDKFDQFRGAGTLLLVDPTGERPTVQIAEDVTRWRMSTDESVIVAEQASARLVLWKEGEGARVVTDGLRGWDLAPSGRTLIFLTRIEGIPRVIHWDVTASGGSGLEAQWQPFTFSPGGESFLYSNMAGDAVLWDGLRNQPILLGTPGRGEPIFGPDGRWLLFERDDGWRLLDLSAPAPIALDEDVDHALFSEDGTALFHGVDRPGTASVSRRDLRTGQTVELARGRGLTRPVFAGPAGDRWLVFSIVPTGESRAKLLGWTEGGGLVTLSERVDGPWSVSPDGAAVAFLDGQRVVVVSLVDGTRSESDELASTAFDPQWQGSSAVLFLSKEGASRHAIFDPERSTTTSLGDFVDRRTCLAAPDGSTTCLARSSPNLGGSKLVRWDRGTGLATEITDGVIDFTQSLSGRRLALRTRAIPSTDEGLLVLVDPLLVEPVPIADGVRQQVITSRWMAWVSNDDDPERSPGVWFTVFPAERIP
ncbi:MAG TPA: carboxypeptidase-like regulatory domain-containing protein [Vulgatibacter sp.]|nr:carboxypeptidase-like regulatory domain-containing protein [Vulgatibacter sp.]